ncbi:hypothetical protein ACHAXM_000636 [Skeletonema potamos]
MFKCILEEHSPEECWGHSISIHATHDGIGLVQVAERVP